MLPIPRQAYSAKALTFTKSGFLSYFALTTSVLEALIVCFGLAFFNINVQHADVINKIQVFKTK